MLEKVRLETRSGDLVAFEFILPLTPPAKAIFWGERCFILHETHQPVQHDDPCEEDITTYREDLLIVIPQPDFYRTQLEGLTAQRQGKNRR